MILKMSNRGQILNDVPVSVPSRSWQDMSFCNTLSLNMGYLYPVISKECLPKDFIKHKEFKFIRCAPMLSPVFGKLNLFSYKFFVRDRDIATYFDSFITNGDQRLDWQQNISNFIPPVKSFFVPLQLLENSVWSLPLVPDTGMGIFNVDDYMSSDNTGYLQVNLDHPIDDDNWSSPSTTIDIDNWYRYYQILRISYNGVDGFNIDILDKYEQQNISTNNRLNTLYIIYRPNYNEFEIDETLRKLDGTDKYQFKKVNPFSPGTLLDYLGIDLKGFYLKQWPLFQRMIWKMENVWSSSVISSHLSAEIEKQFDLKGFFDTHFVAGVLFSGNSNTVNYSSSGLSDQNYQYFTANGFLDPVTLKKDSEAAALATWNSFKYWSSSSSQSQMKHLEMLPVHAYNFIYNEYFRDQNLIPINQFCDFERQGLFEPGAVDDDTLAEFYDYFSLKTKAWEHDCFTSALPGPQRGQAVRFLADASLKVDLGSSSPSPAFANRRNLVLGLDSNGDLLGFGANANTSGNANYSVDVSVDLSSATIENFRWANSMQKFLEKKARTGNRYYELLKGLWDIEVVDAKLNRPIYLSGDKQPIQISEVLQTSSTNADTNQPLGDLAGRGASSAADDYVEFTCPDYGFYMEFVCVVPRTSYMRGLSRKWTRETYLDYPWPDFARLGEELMDKRELLFDGSNEDQPFGFLPRYYDWRYMPDEIHGEFKSSLDFWNFGRDFDTMPALNQKFIEVSSDYRQFAVTNKGYHHFYLSCDNDLQIQTSLPANPVPDL